MISNFKKRTNGIIPITNNSLYGASTIHNTWKFQHQLVWMMEAFNGVLNWRKKIVF